MEDFAPKLRYYIAHHERQRALSNRSRSSVDLRRGLMSQILAFSFQHFFWAGFAETTADFNAEHQDDGLAWTTHLRERFDALYPELKPLQGLSALSKRPLGLVRLTCYHFFEAGAGVATPEMHGANTVASDNRLKDAFEHFYQYMVGVLPREEIEALREEIVLEDVL